MQPGPLRRLCLALSSVALLALFAGTSVRPEPTAPPRYCPACGAQNRPENRFCLKDGTPLPDLLEARRTPHFERLQGTYSPEEVQEVMHRVASSVVRIRVKTKTTYKYPVAYSKDDIAAYFHHAQLGKVETSDSEQRLAGSGFVVGEDGEIVTNAHVATPDGLEADLSIETQDGKSLPARLIGADVASDLALLKVDSLGLPPLPWGESEAIRVGQESWAIGNPLDIGISITRGTMAGITNTRTGLNQVEAFLHSDAHITHGNSGGPLVDVTGHVLGVSDIVWGEAKGQGYSIPSRMARLVVERLRRDGRYARGFVGMHVRPIDGDLIQKYALKRTDGAVVEYVIPGTPAASAGFKPGDVLYGINGRLAPSSYLLQEAISSVGPGAPVKIALDRQGQKMELQVSTAQRPAAPRVDPLDEMQGYMRIRFEEDVKKQTVYVRDPWRSQRAPGLFDGARVKSVLPAQDWPEEPITLNYYRTRAKPVKVDNLADLRNALRRAYLGGRMAATFEVDNPRNPVASVAFDELWPIIL